MAFESARLKLNRAKEHFKSLEAEVNAIQESKHVKIVHEYDADKRLNIWRWEGLPENISAALSPVVGDILTNCAACLDHIMFSFLSSKVNDRDIYWLVSESNHAWSSAKGRLKGLPPSALSIVEDYQPSEKKRHVNSCPLLNLRRLANIDKHRRVIILSLPVRGVGFFKEVVGTASFNLDVAEPGGVLAYMEGEEIQADLDPHFFIGFGEKGRLTRAPLEHTLKQMISTVEEILDKFDELFT